MYFNLLNLVFQDEFDRADHILSEPRFKDGKDLTGGGVSEVFEGMKGHLNEEMVGKTKAVFAFDIKGKRMTSYVCSYIYSSARKRRNSRCVGIVLSTSLFSLREVFFLSLISIHANESAHASKQLVTLCQQPLLIFSLFSFRLFISLTNNNKNASLSFQPLRTLSLLASSTALIKGMPCQCRSHVYRGI